MTRPTVGVIGLGRMGGSAATHLAGEGFDVHGFDPDAVAREAAADAGVEVAADTPALLGGVDVVLTSLPTPAVVEEVYLGDDGVLAAADGPLAAVETSTIDPDTSERIAAAAREAGLPYVDAPVSGGPEAASTGTLTMMVGGDASVVETPPVAPVVDALAGRSYHVGDAGAGHCAKLLNNVMSMGNLLLAMEAMALGAERGLDGPRLLEVLSNAGGSSNQFEKRYPRALNRNFEPGFAVELARKDLGLALEAADGSDQSMPVTSLVHQLYVRAVDEGYGEEDAVAVAKLFEGDRPIESETPVDESYGGY
jgi:3-hydroxyisobutyrate dehydrogenase-like beta-hydroxyacid dehydrogenase